MTTALNSNSQHYLSDKFKLVMRRTSANTLINIKNITIGGAELFVVGGPCSIESKNQLEKCATVMVDSGVQAIRGGAYKPRTSPYDFQGIGKKGIELIAECGIKYSLLTVSELMDVKELDFVASYVDIIQIGARNMQNYVLLNELGKVNNPILLKRGFAANYHELLMAAEYIMHAGNQRVILCERGIRTIETYTRNTLDLNAVPALQELTHLPIMVDPSHGTGRRSLVLPMARAAVAAGAAGVMIETHPDPDHSISDAQQTIDFSTFKLLVQQIHKIKQVLV